MTDDRIPVLKTWKLLIKGAFPRSESGRTLPLEGHDGALLAHLSHASRKDLRDAVEAARGALPAWSGATAYLRGQIVYRLAEMLEGRRADLAAAIAATTGNGRGKCAAEVDMAIDRVVCWAGWCDKHAQVLGCRNPVAGPYHNFSMPEPTGVVAAVQGAAGRRPLLGFVSLVLPPLCAGNAVVAVTDPRHPLGALLVAESTPTADVPAGALNVLTGPAAELAPWIAGHRDVDAVHACVDTDLAAVLRDGAAQNLKRVTVLPPDEDFEDEERWTSPRRLEPFVEIKTIWHPSAV
jgi:acyl-CoA reductase-like NAD-dependent aldehyde dehydrogenase